MTTLSLALPDEMQAFVEAQAAEGGYASAGDYLQALIREAQRRRAKQALEAKFREALESGPATPLTAADWDDLERRVWERHGQDHTPQP